jgi:hypothetical protein
MGARDDTLTLFARDLAGPAALNPANWRGPLPPFVSSLSRHERG